MIDFRKYPPTPPSFSDYVKIKFDERVDYDNNPQSYLNALSDGGLFECLPEIAIRLNLESLNNSQTTSAYPYNLYGSSYTGECVYDPGDHLKAFKCFCDHSYGLLSPEGMKEEWRDGKAYVSVKIQGRDFNHSWDVECDYLSLDFYKFVDAIVYSLLPGLCLKLYKEKMILVNQQGFRNCVYKQLLPVTCYEHGVDGIDHA